MKTSHVFVCRGESCDYNRNSKILSVNASAVFVMLFATIFSCWHGNFVIRLIRSMLGKLQPQHFDEFLVKF